MTPAAFAKIALSFDGAVEGAHGGHADFRAGGRVISGEPFDRFGVTEALGHDADAPLGRSGGSGAGRTLRSRMSAFIPKEGIMIRRLLTAAILAVISGCSDSNTPTDPGNPGPQPGPNPRQNSANERRDPR